VEVGSWVIGSTEISRKQGSGEIYASHNLQISSSNCSSASYLSLGLDVVVKGVGCKYHLVITKCPYT
jgi:hypothetical protein